MASRQHRMRLHRRMLTHPLASPKEPIRRGGQHYEEDCIQQREQPEVLLALAGAEQLELAVGDQACQRRNQRARAADVDAEQQLAVVVREPREQDRRRHVADELAGERGDEQRALRKPAGEQVMQHFNARGVARKDKEHHKGEKQRVVHSKQRVSVGKEQHGGNQHKPQPERHHAEDDQDRERKERKVECRAAQVQPLGKAAVNLEPRGGQQQAADRQHRHGEAERRQHDGGELAGRDRKIGIKIEILRVAERGQHAAEVGGDVLQDEDVRHVLFLLGSRQRKVAERQKGDERHVVGDQHRADEGDVDKRQRERAQIARHGDDLARQNREELDVAQRRHNRQRQKQAGEGAQVKIAEVCRVRRHKTGADCRRQYCHAQHRVAFAEPKYSCHRKPCRIL